MSIVTIQEAQATLSDLIHRMIPGDEIVITDNNQPVARLVAAVEKPAGKVRKLGTLAGSVLNIAPDFDAPLEDFKDYM